MSTLFIYLFYLNETGHQGAVRFVWSIDRQHVPLKICKDCKTKSYTDVSGMFCPAFSYPYFQFIIRETRFT